MAGRNINILDDNDADVLIGYRIADGEASSRLFADLATQTDLEGYLQSVSGTGDISVDNTDPQNPVISLTGGLPTGTVTSVDVAVPTGFAVSGGPVTTTGTITISYDTGYQGYTSAEASKLGFITVTGSIDLDDALLSSAIGTTVQGYDADTAKTDVAQQFTAAQRSNIRALSIVAGEVDWTLAGGNDVSLTATANFTWNLPSDIASYVGQSGFLVITQDGTGGWTMAVEAGMESYNSDTLFDIATGIGEITLVSYKVINSTTIVLAAGGVGVAL